MTSKRTHIAYFKLAFFSVALFGLIGGASIAHADRFDEQINALNQENSASQGALGGLQSQANTYQQAISVLQSQIDGLQADIRENVGKQNATQAKITEAQTKIDNNRSYLKESIKTMYVDGQLSTVEELATSKNLSEYVDKEEYRNQVQNKIDILIKEISAQRVVLQKQKKEIDILVATQKQQNEQLDAARVQQASMLAFNQGQQAEYNNKIAANAGKISDLKKQQIIANTRFISGSSGAAGTGPTCGGGYPAKWCNLPLDAVLDDWGMYNRECVSYTAWKVASSGREMPKWGRLGIGNAWQWGFSSNYGRGTIGGNAAKWGIPIDTNPRAGDIAVSNRGEYGHVMYVESVNGNGTINISQYNASFDGRYSTNTISAAGLAFIHF